MENIHKLTERIRKTLDSAGITVNEDEQEPFKVGQIGFDQYQDKSSETNMYPKEDMRLALLLGLAEETGEVMGKYKKFLRGDLNKSPDKKAKLRGQIKDELGDVIWYVSQIAKEFNITFQEIIDHNIEKLQSRKERNVISGSGDER